MKPQILRNLMRNAMRDNPNGSERDIRNVCLEKSNSPDVQAALFEYWFSNSYRDFVVTHYSQHSVAILPVTRTKAAPIADRIRRVNEVVEKMEARLMDHLLSDGTALRHATFGQCSAEGGWLLTIAKHGRANEVVGKKLTECDLRNLRLRADTSVTTNKQSDRRVA